MDMGGSESAVLNRLGGIKSRTNPAIGRPRAQNLAVFPSPAEKIFFHFLFQKFPVFRLNGAQHVLVDKHGLVGHPLLPGLLRNVFKNSLAELARIGLKRQAG